MDESTLWIVFATIFVALLVLDLFVLNRKDHEMGARRALKYVAFYVAVAVAFGVLILVELGEDSASSYFAAYVIELSMSVDNLFVFIVIFGIFMIPADKQHRVLFWGIIGAIVFRAAFIIVGAELLEMFDFMMYIFGIILLYTAFKTAFGDDDDDEEGESLAFRLSKHIPAIDDLSSGRFFTLKNGKRLATPLFLCLVVIEVSDIMFAFDSIPAALSISTDIFIVYTSNIFAVLGLRAMYFVIKNALGAMDYLKYGLGAILAFIGAKMLLSAANILEVSVTTSLMVIIVILAVTIAVSLIHRKAEGPEEIE